jgi:hypothetical protein
VDGVNHIGKVPSVTLPKVTRKTEDYQGGGMLGSVAVDLGLDSGALDASMIVGGVVEELILKYGGDIDEMRLRFVGEFTAAVPARYWKLRCADVSPKSIRVMRNRVMIPTTPTPSKTPTTSCQWTISRCWKSTC